MESAKAALAQAKVSPEQIQHVVYGNVVQTSSDAIYLPRHVGLRTGVPVPVPALGVNRLCGSGFQAFVTAAELMLTEQASCVLAGGTESMSQAPHVIRGARWGIPLGKGGLEDMLWSALTDSYTGQAMALTAEQLAVDYSSPRSRWTSTRCSRRSASPRLRRRAGSQDEICRRSTLKGKKGDTVFAKDEHNRPETTRGGAEEAAQGVQEGRRGARGRGQRHLRRRGLHGDGHPLLRGEARA